MPGLNQRGPLDQGPMTGGRRGVCTGGSRIGQGTAQRGTMAYGQPGGPGRGRRGCRGGGRWMAGADQGSEQAGATEQALKDQAEILEAQLTAVKKQLKDLTAAKE